MAGKTTPVLLVTANVGSIFEDPSHMLKIWTEEFLSTVAKLDPKFIALHCQEVGGKNYERSMKHVEDFVRLFMSSEELRLFDKVRVFLDEDYSSAENFTALGNFYFIHESLAEVLIWDFAAMNFVSAKGKEVHSGNIEAVTTKEKSKFPQDFFPECKWSRKGFLRTRWSLNGTVFDLINIHLFHDASNFIAMESFPSVYSKNRKRALEHTLERFHNDSYGIAPFFVFGDFNFRTDTQGVINKLSDGLNVVRVQSNKNNDHTKLHYKDEESQVVLSLGKKEFSHADHQKVFLDDNGLWLKEFDREMESFGGRLFEFPISFPPSYPFEEDEKGGNDYMKTRCPAWCDRVLLSNTAKNLVNNISDPNFVEYGLMGPNTRMGDHKPVYLKMDLINNAGTVSCCTPCESSSSEKRVLCFGNVAVCETASWSCSSLSLKNSGSAPSALTLKLDTSAAALAADCFLAPPHASLLHEPYTPESMETPTSSPVPLRIERDFEEVDWKSGLEEDGECSGTNETDDIKATRENNQNLRINDTTDVHQTKESEFNIKQSFSFVNKSSQFGVKSCIPHVLICFSDPQDRSVSKSNLEMKSSDVNLESNFTFNQSLSHQDLSHLKCSEDSTSPEDSKVNICHKFLTGVEERTNDIPVQPVEILENERHKIYSECQDNLLSPQNTCSSDSGILPSASFSSSSSQSLAHSTSKEVTSDLNEVENEEELCSKNGNLFQLKRLVSDLSTEYDERKSSSECALGSTYLASEQDSHHCKSENEIVRVDDIPIDNLRLNIPSEENVASCDTNSSDVENDQSKIVCLVPEGVSEEVHRHFQKVVPSPSSKLGICANMKRDSESEKLANIPLNSQDSISIVHSEISSQDKKTKRRKYKKKEKNIKTKSSNCCSVS